MLSKIVSVPAGQQRLLRLMRKVRRAHQHAILASPLLPSLSLAERPQPFQQELRLEEQRSRWRAEI